MVWGEACEIGCAIGECLNSVLDPTSDSQDYSYLLVCVYGPRFPKTVDNQHPYQRGRNPCRHCPNRFGVCDTIDVPAYNGSTPTGIMATGDVGNLCCM